MKLINYFMVAFVYAVMPCYAAERSTPEPEQEPVKAAAEQSAQVPQTACLIWADNVLVSQGFAISKEGLVATKFSLPLEEALEIHVTLPDRRMVRASLAARDDETGLALLKLACATPDFISLKSAGEAPSKLGSFVKSYLAGCERKCNYGIISAKARPLTGDPRWKMGIMVKTEERDGEKVQFVHESKNALLKKGDVLQGFDNAKFSLDAMLDRIRRYKEGDVIQMRILRGKREIKINVACTTNDGTNGFSVRKAYKQVIQHDMNLTLTDFGSPLFDNRNIFIGVNIARHDNAEIVSLPASLAVPALEKMMVEARRVKGPRPLVIAERTPELEQKVIGLIPSLVEKTVNITYSGASGSGVIVSRDGLILTAAHVADDKKLKYTIVMHDGTRYKARLLWTNPEREVALLKIKQKVDLPFAKISDDVTAGDWSLVTGHPHGRDKKRGTVVRMAPVITARENRIRTQIQMDHGDSGGPVFNLKGEVFGVNSMMIIGKKFHARVYSKDLKHAL